MGARPDDLFETAAQRRLAASAPLAARLRPRTLDEVVGQDHLLGPGKPLRRLIESDRLSSVILWGPPGTGRPPSCSSTLLLTLYTYGSYDPGPWEQCGIHHFAVGVRHTLGVSTATLTPSDDLRVQLVNHRGGRRSYIVLDLATGSVHARADRFLAPFSEGTQRTYAYHLIDHLRWLAATGRVEDTVTIDDLKRYMALCGAEHSGPLGVPWRERPLGEAALGCGRAA